MNTVQKIGVWCVAVALVGAATKIPIAFPLPSSSSTSDKDQVPPVTSEFARQVGQAVPADATAEDRARWAAMLEQFGRAVVVDADQTWPAMTDSAELAEYFERALRYRAELGGEAAAWPPAWEPLRQLVGAELNRRLNVAQGQPAVELSDALRLTVRQVLVEAAAGVRG